MAMSEDVGSWVAEVRFWRKLQRLSCGVWGVNELERVCQSLQGRFEFEEALLAMWATAWEMAADGTKLKTEENWKGLQRDISWEAGEGGPVYEEYHKGALKGGVVRLMRMWKKGVPVHDVVGRPVEVCEELARRWAE